MILTRRRPPSAGGCLRQAGARVEHRDEDGDAGGKAAWAGLTVPVGLSATDTEPGLTGCGWCRCEPVVRPNRQPSCSRSVMSSPTSGGSAAERIDTAADRPIRSRPGGSGRRCQPRRPDRSPRPAEPPPTTGRVALGVRSRSDALAGQLLKQRPYLGLEEPSVSAWRPDAVYPAGGRPPRHRLRVDAEQCGHLTRREQSLPWVHSLPLVLDSHAVQGQGSARADTQ